MNIYPGVSPKLSALAPWREKIESGKRLSRAKRAKDAKVGDSNFEARNPKQIQMTKTYVMFEFE
jgi:hypothetical protein